MTATFDLLITGAHLATMAGDTPYGAIRDGAIGVRGETIAWVGRRARPAARRVGASVARCARRVGNARAHRLPHASRLRRQSRRRVRSAPQRRDVCAKSPRAGGGIKATVRATRAASDDELVGASRPRLAALADEGVTTVEIKSGYGLDTTNELRQLRAARRVAADVGVDVRTTLLAAHALPPEFSGRADDYIDLVCGEIIPAAAARASRMRSMRSATRSASRAAQTRRVFAAARAHGLPVKLHADQLSDTGGAALAAEFGALSADHIEYTSDAGVEAMARAGYRRRVAAGRLLRAARDALAADCGACARGACPWPSHRTAIRERRRRRRCR